MQQKGDNGWQAGVLRCGEIGLKRGARDVRVGKYRDGKEMTGDRAKTGGWNKYREKGYSICEKRLGFVLTAQ